MKSRKTMVYKTRTSRTAITVAMTQLRTRSSQAMHRQKVWHHPRISPLYVSSHSLQISPFNTFSVSSSRLPSSSPPFPQPQPKPPSAQQLSPPFPPSLPHPNQHRRSALSSTSPSRAVHLSILWIGPRRSGLLRHGRVASRLMERRSA